MGECWDEVDPVGKANVFTQFPVDLFMDALVDDGLHTHVFEHVLNGKVKGDAVFIVIDQLCFLLEECGLLQKKFLIEANGFNVLLQDRDHLEI